jgi:hypothetical protein
VEGAAEFLEEEVVQPLARALLRIARHLLQVIEVFLVVLGCNRFGNVELAGKEAIEVAGGHAAVGCHFAMVVFAYPKCENRFLAASTICVRTASFSDIRVPRPPLSLCHKNIRAFPE